MWERDAGLSEHVAQAWEEDGPKASLGDVRMGLEKVMGHLQEWSKAKFGAINRERK
jgi:hypothetical protein